MMTPEAHQKRIARKSLSMNRVGRSVAGLPLAEAYRIIFRGSLAERLAELIREYPNVTEPNFLSWELGCQQNCATTDALRDLLAEVTAESPR